MGLTMYHHHRLKSTNMTPPAVSVYSNESQADRSSAVDFVNRVNWHFERNNIGNMLESFTTDAVAFHFHGEIRGHEAMRHFFEVDYQYLIPGVCRVAANHIVDEDGDGVVVYYQNLLVRHTWPLLDEENTAQKTEQNGLRHSEGNTPGIWLYSPMIDRLTKTPTGWKIWERYIGASTMNVDLSPNKPN